MNNKTKKLVYTALIGALYAALTMALAPISYGSIQLRVSEVMCILPFFFPPAALGLTLGCVIANTISTAGMLDIVFGSLASLLAGLSTAKVGKSARAVLFASHKGIVRNGRGNKAIVGLSSCIYACAMPIIFNGPIIGAILAFAFSRDAFWEGFVLFSAQVAIGEAIVMFALGLPLMRYIIARERLVGFFAALESGQNSEKGPRTF